jgi:hypothetical protein
MPELLLLLLLLLHIRASLAELLLTVVNADSSRRCSCWRLHTRRQQ